MIYNPDGIRNYLEPKKWMMYCNIQLVTSCTCIFYHLYYFNMQERGHLTFSIVYLMVIVFGVLICYDGVTNFLQTESALDLFIVMLASIVLIVIMVRSETVS